MRYLLDSNAVIALMAADDGVVRRIEATVPGEVVISSIILFELMFGAFNSRRVDANLDRLAGLDLPKIEFDERDARRAGEVRARLKRAGTPIGPYDLLIAGQALARNLVLVTANFREFGRVEGLAVEDWARSA